MALASSFFIIIRNVDYFYTHKFNWIPVSRHWDDIILVAGMTKKKALVSICAH
nr:hypothetical protein M1L25_000049 [Wolbachia endosymbiont of Ostrinia furnacalis]